MVRIPTQRRPTHPGQMLKEEFFHRWVSHNVNWPDRIGVPYRQINESLTVVGGPP
jgi:plasmid maintenance system antidote protein VapI